MDQQSPVITHGSAFIAFLASIKGMITPEMVYLIIAIAGLMVSFISAWRSNKLDKKRTDAIINFLERNDHYDAKDAPEVIAKLDVALESVKDK